MEVFASLPVWYLPLTVFIFGIIIGSFLNVVIYRLHTGRSLSGHSHCLSCGTRLRAFELVPLLSYLFLRGRCRSCGSYVPVRYLLVELLTGLLFLAVYFKVTDWFVGLCLLVVVSLLVLITAYDLYHLIIPDELVLGLLIVWLALGGYQVWTLEKAWLAIGYDLGAAFLGSLFLYGLWSYSKGRWIGFGDVKLALPLGLIVGYQSVFSFITVSFWAGALVGVVLLGLEELKRGQPHLRLFKRQFTMKSAVPFAPFMIFGFLTTLFFSFDVLTLFIHD